MAFRTIDVVAVVGVAPTGDVVTSSWPLVVIVGAATPVDAGNPASCNG